jgi:hypothetical protein
MEGCDDDVLADIASYASTCTACIIANNCDDADLNVDENKLLLPEQFALHPVYPNPFKILQRILVSASNWQGRCPYLYMM